MEEEKEWREPKLQSLKVELTSQECQSGGAPDGGGGGICMVGSAIITGTCAPGSGV